MHYCVILHLFHIIFVSALDVDTFGSIIHTLTVQVIDRLVICVSGTGNLIHQHQQYVFGGLFSSISPPPLVCQGGILVSSALSTWETVLAE